ncbi:MarR family transcriptional regulator [Caldivirga sp. UBA161]|uniref:MarR family transcriptional regulator n=1 Tax=Caldivirga sp. UBA161 TaxID=1915569 RepID=UPI0025B99E28|nr:MarR family transcriptional regulator [Caldivirga sp. UBA161]
MKIMVLTKDGKLPREFTEDGEVDSYSLTADESVFSRYDFIGVLGTDRFILSALHKLAGLDKPIITIGYGAGYLNTVNVADFNDLMNSLKKGNYTIEVIPTLTTGQGYVAVNDIVIAPARSATLMEYTLIINNEYAWRDSADGLIVATPIGSTAYALSAGGVLIYGGLRSFEIVPINSTNIARVPVIVPDDSRIVISDLLSRSKIEVIADGLVRRNINTTKVTIFKGPEIKLVKLSTATTLDRYRRIIESMISDLPPSAKLILKVLEYEGPLTPKEIIEKTLIPQRTVRASLRLLLRKGLVNRLIMPRGSSRLVTYSISNGTKLNIK